LVFICVAIPLLLLSWLGAVSRAKKSGEDGWVGMLILLPPVIVMWLYICRRQPAQPPSPPLPPQPVPKVVIFPMADPEKFFRQSADPYGLGELIGNPPISEPTSKPLVLRQAIEAVEEAAKDYPDW
jgi:hypothetical protein